MILVKDRTGSKNGTADSTLVGVFDSKRPLYRIVKWLILHIFPPVFRLLYGFRVVGRIPEEKMQNGCISVCNHVHKLDCVMMACVFQDYTMLPHQISLSAEKEMIRRMQRQAEIVEALGLMDEAQEEK